MGIDPTSPDFPRHVETRYQGIVRLTVIVVGISIVFLSGTCFQLVRGIVGRPLFNWNFDLNLDFGPPMGMSVAECAAPRLMAAFDRTALADAVAVDTSYGVAEAVDAAGARRPLFTKPYFISAARWSPDGEWLVMDFEPGHRLVGRDAQLAGAPRIEYPLEDPDVPCVSRTSSHLGPAVRGVFSRWGGTTVAVHVASGASRFWLRPGSGTTVVTNDSVLYGGEAQVRAPLGGPSRLVSGDPWPVDFEFGWRLADEPNGASGSVISLAAFSDETLVAVAPPANAVADGSVGVVVRSRRDGTSETLGPWWGTDAVHLRADLARHRVVGVERRYNICVPEGDTPFVIDTVTGSVTRFPVAAPSQLGGVVFASIASSPDGSLLVGRREVGPASDRDPNGCPVKPPGWSETFRVGPAGDLIPVTDLSPVERLLLDADPPRPLPSP